MTKNRLKKIPVTFINSPELIANYYCFLAKHIQNGFYQKQHFIVLPYLSDCFQSVFFPNLKLNSGFWHQIKNCPNSSVARPFPQKAVEYITSKFPPAAKSERKENIPTDLFNQPLIASELNRISSITVLPTQFGTKSSFHFQKKAGKYQVFMTLRSDQPRETIDQSLLNIALLIKNPQFGYELFSERRAIVDFLTNAKKEREQNNRELADSLSYLNKLGFGQKKAIKRVQGEIFVSSKLARRYLSSQEYLVLDNLFLKKTLSIEEIGNILWPNDPDKFSPWAITQLVHRLKNKIKAMGVNENIIFSQRSKGYFLTT